MSARVSTAVAVGVLPLVLNVLGSATYDWLKANAGQSVADILRSPSLPLVAFAILAALWLAYWLAVDPYRRKGRSADDARGTRDPIGVDAGNRAGITRVLAESDPITSREELQAARRKLTDAISAFANQDEFNRDPLRFERHWYGESTAAIHALISRNWPQFEPAVGRALANTESTGYDWMRSAMGRLDDVVAGILNGGGGPRTPPRSASTPLRPDDLSATVSTVHPAIRRADEPPSDWAAPYWQGRQVLPCPWDSYRTIDPTKLAAHTETHTDPPTDQTAHEQYDEPRPWAKLSFHFIGDGAAYVNGVTTDPYRTQFGSRQRVDELLANGLFAEGVAPPRPSPGLAHSELVNELSGHNHSEGLVGQQTAAVRGVREGLQKRLRKAGDWPPVAPKLAHTPEELARSIGPDDVIRAFISLHDRGEEISGKFARMSPPIGEGLWTEATLALGDWLNDVARVIDAQRPKLVLRMREIRARQPVGQLDPAAPLVTVFYRQQIAAVCELIRDAIG